AFDRDADDDELIARARNGETRAFGHLVERHYDFIYRVAHRWCGARADAQDIAQDVCMRLAAAIRTYRGSATFTSWLYVLTLNAARDFARRSKREGSKADSFSQHIRLTGGAFDDGEARARALWDAVRRLPEKQRDAVLLVHGEGLTHAAASDVMGIS